MAAKPPKPPGNFLKSLLNQHNNNSNNNNKILQQHQQQLNHEDNNDVIEGNNRIISNSSSGGTEQYGTATKLSINPISDTGTTTSPPSPTTIATKKGTTTTTATNNCNCSNISIMHLFHEMKQEFPTIPDTIVAQCVNENCHQRENCIQMLRNELELHPIAAQSYPAKVLHPPNNNNNNHQNSPNNNIVGANTPQKPPLQQKPLVVLQQKPPLKPIKPIRTAPLQPPTTAVVQQQNNGNNNSNSKKLNSILNKNSTTTSASTNKPLDDGEYLANNEVVLVGSGDAVGDFMAKGLVETTTSRNSPTPTSVEVNSNNNNNNENVCIGDGEFTGESNLPRQRPTTLNLNTQLQKQQRQRLNVQLQQRFQEQRNKQQQQQQQQQPQQQPPSQNHAIIIKPLRKAPLPPIAPKPLNCPPNPTLTNTPNTVNNSFLNDSALSSSYTPTTTASSPLSESEISVSVSLSTPSPTSTPNKSNTTTTTHQQHLQTKSPIRHRSVITLQPEPPYTRDFLYTPNSYSSSTPSSPSLAAPPITTLQSCNTNSSSSANSSPTASVAGSQKSFTSVNLTLRPPVSPTGNNSALQPSTIDITAGPGFSGASGGGKRLHYSSTSYDARLGYQQNFQITVTDEGGVFSACRLKPQLQQQQPRCLNQPQQFHNNNVLALQQNIQQSIYSPHGIGGVQTSSGFGSIGDSGGNMCLPPQLAMDGPTQEIIQRQKKKRDKLAAALREYKKRLGNVEQEINLLTGSIPTEGLSERLDDEITKLRRDCESMLRSSSNYTQPQTAASTTQQEIGINHQPQPFPRQRNGPPPRPPPPRQTSLDIIQHHSQSSTPHTPPAASLPNLNYHNSSPLLLQQQQLLQQSSNSLNSPSSYQHQHSAPLLGGGGSGHISSNHHNDFYNDQSYYADPNDPIVPEDDDDYDEYEEVVEPWECNMCTFRNHPQLNICETCENVRILPGRLANITRTLSATNCTNNTAALTPTALGAATAQ